jgi:hypothetical protein
MFRVRSHASVTKRRLVSRGMCVRRSLCDDIKLGFQGAALLAGGAGVAAHPCRPPRRREAPFLPQDVTWAHAPVSPMMESPHAWPLVLEQVSAQILAFQDSARPYRGVG